jgi:hypothetical protein
MKPEEDYFYKKGFEIGIEKHKHEMIARLVLKTDLSNEQIAEIANVPVGLVEKIREEQGKMRYSAITRFYKHRYAIELRIRTHILKLINGLTPLAEACGCYNLAPTELKFFKSDFPARVPSYTNN